MAQGSPLNYLAESSHVWEAHDVALELNKLATLQWFGMVVGIHVISGTVPNAHKTLVYLIGDEEIMNVKVS